MTLQLPPFPEFVRDVLGLDPESRRASLAIHKALDGLDLDPEELELFRQYTGREPRPEGFAYLLKLVGRQSGKTEAGGARLVYEGAAASLAGEQNVSVVGVAQGHREAKGVLFSYVQRFLDRPLLRDLVTDQTRDTVTLRGGVRILVVPCKPEALRGLRCRAVVLDEVAHFRSSENIPLDEEVWRAALATTLTTGGKVLALSSPYAASGLAYDLHRKHYGNPSADVLVWQSPSYVLHPGLSKQALDRIREVDPEGAEAEIEGQFLRNVSQLLDDEALESALDRGVTVRPPQDETRYRAFVDISTGVRSGGSRWACAIAHQEAGVSVLDALLVVTPPFSPVTAAQQTANLCDRYKVRTVVGDRFAQGFSDNEFRRVGLKYEPAPTDKSGLFLHLAAALQSGTVRLLESEDLLREARGLERRRGSTRDRVQARRGQRDDTVNAAAGAVYLASRRKRKRSATWGRSDSSRTVRVQRLTWDRHHRKTVTTEEVEL